LDRTRLIKQKALEVGFLACGIAKAEKLVNEEARIESYLQHGFHGTMTYMENHQDKRLDPTLLVPGARSVIVALLNYYPSEFQHSNTVPIVSKYAYGRDYHFELKERLSLLWDFVRKEIDPKASGRFFTDSAPVLERSWAVKAGLGWIGKNGLLLHPHHGSFCFIGELITDLELDYDLPYRGEHCGNCTRCLDACPTKAIKEPYCLDARDCLSYLTIELKEEIPEKHVANMNNRVFGCDICQDVCPWNRLPKPHDVAAFMPLPEFIKLDRKSWENLDETRFESLFAHTAMKRTGFAKIKKNIKDCLKELGD